MFVARLTNSIILQWPGWLVKRNGNDIDRMIRTCRNAKSIIAQEKYLPFHLTFCWSINASLCFSTLSFDNILFSNSYCLMLKTWYPVSIDNMFILQCCNASLFYASVRCNQTLCITFKNLNKFSQNFRGLATSQSQVGKGSSF